MKRKLYVAYGANINKSAMRRRCVGARPLGRFMLTNARLVFRGAADLEFDPHSTVPCALWLIDEYDERELDRYEGIAGGHYFKSEEIILKYKGEPTPALIYLMVSRGVYPPTQDYVNRIRQGYRDFGLDEAYLDAAVKHSYENKDPTDWELQRRARQRRSSQRLVRLPEKVALERLDAVRARELDPNEFENKLVQPKTLPTPGVATPRHHKKAKARTEPWPRPRPKTVAPAPKLKLTDRNAVIYGD